MVTTALILGLLAWVLIGLGGLVAFLDGNVKKDAELAGSGCGMFVLGVVAFAFTVAAFFYIH